jgi:hypothetical protein
MRQERIDTPVMLIVQQDAMSNEPEYSEVERYLRRFSTSEPPYDFNGLLHLVLAATDNLREHATDQDFLDFASAITDEQALFLRRLLDSRTSNAGLEKDT